MGDGDFHPDVVITRPSMPEVRPRRTVSAVGHRRRSMVGSGEGHEHACKDHAHGSRPMKPKAPAAEHPASEAAVLGRVTERSMKVAVVELPHAGHKDSNAGGAASPKSARRILHVEPAPFHDCLALACAWHEAEHQAALSEAPSQLQPRTQQRFKDLQGAGSFPKRRLVAAARRERGEPASYPSGTLSARLPGGSAEEPALAGRPAAGECPAGCGVEPEQARIHPGVR